MFFTDWSGLMPALLLEDGGSLLLEDGGELLLEGFPSIIRGALLLEDGSALLLEDGAQLMLEDGTTGTARYTVTLSVGA